MFTTRIDFDSSPSSPNDKIIKFSQNTVIQNIGKSSPRYFAHANHIICAVKQQDGFIPKR
jgi:hypothetical protein